MQRKTVYLCTDQQYLYSGMPLEKAVELAIEGGVSLVQLREKNDKVPLATTVTTKEFIGLAERVLKITRKHKVPLLINDRLDVMLAVGADGVHMGQKDVPVRIVRRLVGKEKLICISTSSVGEALDAQAGGADFIVAGEVYPTGLCYPDPEPVIGIEGLRAICNAVTIPVFARGKCNVSNFKEVMSTGATGVSVVRAIIAQEDILRASTELCAALRNS